MHDDKAMQVLQEINDLIQERIGSSMKPDAVEVKAISMEPTEGSESMGSDEMNPDDDSALASLYESEGVGKEMGEEHTEDESERLKKMMGKG